MGTNVLIVLSRRRWLVVPLLSLAASLVSWLSLTESPSSRLGINEWDVLIGVFNSPVFVAVVLPIVFFSLTVDLLTDDFTDSWKHYLVNRYKSRLQWWGIKLATIAIATIVFVGLLWVVAILFAAIAVPLQLQWSRASASILMGYVGGLSPYELRQPPPLIMAKLWILLAVGLFAWSTLVIAMSTISRRAIVGWVIGVVAAMVSYGTWMLNPAAGAWAPTLQFLLEVHFNYFPGASHIPPYFTLSWSLIWDVGVWILASTVGYVVFRRRVL